MLFFFVVALNCTGSRDGILVGNPGDGAMQVAGAKGMQLRGSYALIERLSLVDCSDQRTLVAQGVGVALDGSARLALPAGTWCGVELTLSGPLELRYQQDQAEVEMRLELPVQLALGTALVVDGGSYLLELGVSDWVDPASLDLVPGELLVLDSASSQYASLVSALSDLRVGQDSDSDGELDESEVLFGGDQGRPGDGDDDNDDAESKQSHDSGEPDLPDSGTEDSGTEDSGTEDDVEDSGADDAEESDEDE